MFSPPVPAAAVQVKASQALEQACPQGQISLPSKSSQAGLRRFQPSGPAPQPSSNTPFSLPFSAVPSHTTPALAFQGFCNLEPSYLPDSFQTLPLLGAALLPLPAPFPSPLSIQVFMIPALSGWPPQTLPVVRAQCPAQPRRLMRLLDVTDSS